MHFPKNGWALHGMQFAYLGLENQIVVKAIDAQLDLVWADADIELNGSRIK